MPSCNEQAPERDAATRLPKWRQCPCTHPCSEPPPRFCFLLTNSGLGPYILLFGESYIYVYSGAVNFALLTVPGARTRPMRSLKKLFLSIVTNWGVQSWLAWFCDTLVIGPTRRNLSYNFRKLPCSFTRGVVFFQRTHRMPSFTCKPILSGVLSCTGA